LADLQAKRFKLFGAVDILNSHKNWEKCSALVVSAGFADILLCLRK